MRKIKIFDFMAISNMSERDDYMEEKINIFLQNKKLIDIKIIPLSNSKVLRYHIIYEENN